MLYDHFDYSLPLHLSASVTPFTCDILSTALETWAGLYTRRKELRGTYFNLVEETIFLSFWNKRDTFYWYLVLVFVFLPTQYQLVILV